MAYIPPRAVELELEPEVAATYDELGRDGDLVYDPGLWLGLWPEDSVGLATA